MAVPGSRDTATLATSRQVTQPAFSRGFPYAFPVILGGTESLRALRDSAEALPRARPTADLAVSSTPRSG